MAERGKPIPFSTRQVIKDRKAEPLRKVAKELNVSVNTVRKYNGSLIQKPCN